jgi:transcriptional regulator with XRE-family HTH domain
LSQARLGSRINLDRAEISKFECAKRDPCLDMIIRLAAGLEIPAGDLLRGIGEAAAGGTAGASAVESPE